MKVINITEYHAKDFGFIYQHPGIKEVFKQGNDKIKFPFKNMSDSNIWWSKQRPNLTLIPQGS